MIPNNLRGRYSHIDDSGMLWRFEGGRPISRLADEVMQSVWDERGDIMRLQTIAKKAVKSSGKKTVPELDLSFLSSHRTLRFADSDFAVPVFGVFRFDNAHALGSCCVQFSRSEFAEDLGYCIDRSLILGHLDEESRPYVLLCGRCSRAWEGMNLSGGKMTVVASVSRPVVLREGDKRVTLIQRGQMLITPRILGGIATTDKYLLRALDRDWQFTHLEHSCYGIYRHSTIQISATYDGVLPVSVQQLTHKAKRDYEEVVLIAEANWEVEEVEEIRPVDPLVVGIKKDKAYLLCKFEETIEENYYAREFSG